MKLHICTHDRIPTVTLSSTFTIDRIKIIKIEKYIYTDKEDEYSISKNWIIGSN